MKILVATLLVACAFTASGQSRFFGSSAPETPEPEAPREIVREAPAPRTQDQTTSSQASVSVPLLPAVYAAVGRYSLTDDMDARTVPCVMSQDPRYSRMGNDPAWETARRFIRQADNYAKDLPVPSASLAGHCLLQTAPWVTEPVLGWHHNRVGMMLTRIAAGVALHEALDPVARSISSRTQNTDNLPNLVLSRLLQPAVADRYAKTFLETYKRFQRSPMALQPNLAGSKSPVEFLIPSAGYQVALSGSGMTLTQNGLILLGEGKISGRDYTVNLNTDAQSVTR